MDYAQLGLSAAQTAKMSEMASELGRLREVAEEKERQADKVRNLRRVILTTGDLLDSLEADSSGKESGLPKQFVVLHQTQEMLGGAGVLPPTDFDDWEDMERANKLGKRIEAYRDWLLKAMTDVQRYDAERCLTYMAEEKDLRNLIWICSEREELKRKKKRVAQIEAKLKAKVAASPVTRGIRGFQKLGCAVLIGSTVLILILGLLIGTDLIPNGNSPDGRLTQQFGLVLCFVFLLGCAMFLGQFLVRALSREKVIPADIRKLELELGELEGEIEEAEGAEGEGSLAERVSVLIGEKINVNALTKKFGNVKDADKLRISYEERRDFVRGIVGPQYLAKSKTHEDEHSENE